MMQQVQAFPPGAEAYQQRCTGVGNIGIGTTFPGASIATTTGPKHYKAVHTANVHANGFTNFSYMQPEPDARAAMTRIVFSGDAGRNGFHYGMDGFQNCMTGGEVMDNAGNYHQLNFLNGNPNVNMRYMRQQPMNPAFHGDGQMQRCYIQQRPQQQGQGQQSRFVRMQGSKIRPNNAAYRNFNANNNNQQQRQNKQNRRFTTKNFANNYKKPVSPEHQQQPDGYFEEDCNNSAVSPNRFRLPPAQPDFKSPESKAPVHKASTSHHHKKESQHSSKSKAYRSVSGGMDSHSRLSNKGNNAAGDGFLEPKVEYVGKSHDLSYDDITENSDVDEDSDLREKLIRKKQDLIIKREPGELSDEDDAEEPLEQEREVKRKSKRKSSDDESQKRFKSSDATERSEAKLKEAKKSQKSGRKEFGKGSSHSSYNSAHSYHDDRSPSSKEVKSQGNNAGHKSSCPGTCYNSPYPDYCSPDAEVIDLKEKMRNLKESLRDAQDKLLEANVVGSKKAMRMQEEIAQLKKKLEESGKTEVELKVSLKNLENELSCKNAELAKMALLNEVEKQEKAKLNMEMTRTYKERLTIEVEKLRALFDVEVAKMQAFYMSSSLYEDDSGAAFPSSDTSSSSDMQSQNESTPRNEVTGMSNDVDIRNVEDINHTREVNSRPNAPFVHPSYFNNPTVPHTSQSAMALAGRMAPFSMFENVMAYNSLIHHQQVYAQTTAATIGSGCSDSTTGNNMNPHNGM